MIKSNFKNSWLLYEHHKPTNQSNGGQEHTDRYKKSLHRKTLFKKKHVLYIILVALMY
jgi:hypothetical protein